MHGAPFVAASVDSNAKLCQDEVERAEGKEQIKCGMHAAVSGFRAIELSSLLCSYHEEAASMGHGAAV